MIRRLIAAAILCAGFLCFPVVAQEKTANEKIDLAKISPENFLSYVRRAPSKESWALMEGTATHRRSGFRTIKSDIRFAVRFLPTRVTAQLRFNQNEYYNLGQTFAVPPVSTKMVHVKDPANTELSKYGIESSDLTLGFLYQDMLAEEKQESVKGQNCRVFLMKSQVPGEIVRVFISTDYLFPLKAEWFKGDPQKDPKLKAYRNLEIDSVKKENDFWLITGLKLYGPDWRTMISFDKRLAGYPGDAAMPSDLFLLPPVIISGKDKNNE